MKRPTGVIIISIVTIVYGLLDIGDFLFFQPVVTEKRIEYSIPFLGIIFLISGVGALASKPWARVGIIIGCMLATFYSVQDIYYGGLPAGIFTHVVFIILYALVIFYLTRPRISMAFKGKSTEVSRDQKPVGKIGDTFVGIMIIIYFAIHIWTIWISYSTYGIIGAGITLVTPILSQIFWFVQFWRLTDTFLNPYCIGVVTYLAIWVIFMCWDFTSRKAEGKH